MPGPYESKKMLTHTHTHTHTRARAHIYIYDIKIDNNIIN